MSQKNVPGGGISTMRTGSLWHAIMFLLCIMTMLWDYRELQASDFPTFLELYRDDGTEVLSLQCESVDQKKTACNVEQLKVILPREPRAKELRDKLAQYDKEAATMTDGDHLVYFKGMCFDFKDFLLELDSMAEAGIQVEPYRVAFKGLRDTLPKLCNRELTSRDEISTATKRLLTDIADGFAAKEKRCCGLAVERKKIEFTLIAKNKWASSSAPAGPCGLTTAYAFECADEGFPCSLTETNSWNDTSSSGCKQPGEESTKPGRWSSEASQFFKVPCDYIDWSRTN